MMGADSCNNIVTRGLVEGRNGEALAYSEPRGKKMFYLAPLLEKGAIVLKGHVKDAFPIFVGDVSRRREGDRYSTRSSVMDGKGGKFVDAAEDGGETLIKNLKDNLAFHTLKQDQEFTLYRIVDHEVGNDVVVEDDFASTLISQLGDATDINGVGAMPVGSKPKPAKLLTDVMKRKLREAQIKRDLAVESGAEYESKPMFKIFDPQGAGTWFLCSLEEDNDTLWAVCDLGMGCVEYGTVLLSDLESRRGGPLNLPLERDIHFTGTDLVMSELLSQTSL